MADLFHFFIPDLDSGSTLLPALEARHAVSALRMREGDAFTATDGKGLWAECRFDRLGKGEARFRVVEQRQEERAALQLNLFVAPTKNHDRLEWLAEKAQELGVAGLTVCYTEHSVRQRAKLERLKNVVIAALKQSRATYIMAVQDLAIQEALQQAKADEGANYVCYLGPLAESKNLQQGTIRGRNGVVNLFIGPEGDFSQKEIEWMLLNEFNPIRLTHTRLRTETAALAAASTWMCLA